MDTDRRNAPTDQSPSDVRTRLRQTFDAFRRWPRVAQVASVLGIMATVILMWMATVGHKSDAERLSDRYQKIFIDDGDPSGCGGVCGDPETGYKGDETIGDYSGAITEACSDVLSGNLHFSYVPESVSAAESYCADDPEEDSVNIATP